MFKSIDKTALQEIGPRFTLKLRWLRKGLPAVTGGGSVATAPEQNTMEEEDDDRLSDEEEEVELKGGRGGKGKKSAKEPKLDGEDEEEEEVEEFGGDAEEEEKAARKKAMEGIPLDKQGEFEWKWKVRSARVSFLSLASGGLRGGGGGGRNEGLLQRWRSVGWKTKRKELRVEDRLEEGRVVTPLSLSGHRDQSPGFYPLSCCRTGRGCRSDTWRVIGLRKEDQSRN